MLLDGGQEEVSSMVGRTNTLFVKVEHLDEKVGGSTRACEKPVAASLTRLCALSHCEKVLWL